MRGRVRPDRQHDAAPHCERVPLGLTFFLILYIYNPLLLIIRRIFPPSLLRLNSEGLLYWPLRQMASIATHPVPARSRGDVCDPTGRACCSSGPLSSFRLSRSDRRVRNALRVAPVVRYSTVSTDFAAPVIMWAGFPYFYHVFGRCWTPDVLLFSLLNVQSPSASRPLQGDFMDTDDVSYDLELNNAYWSRRPLEFTFRGIEIGV